MNNASVSDTLQTVRDCLERIGYQDKLLIPDYKFRDFTAEDKASDNTSLSIELAAFAQFPASYRSACIGVTITQDHSAQTIGRFRALGAPQILALNPNTYEMTRWRVPAQGLPESIIEPPTQFNDIEDIFAAKQIDWAPDTILRAKEIAFTSTPSQLDFIDAGYLPALEEELRSKLLRDFRNILASCKNIYRLKHSEEVFEAESESLYRLLFRLIVAKYAIDRQNQPDWATLPASEVVDAVEAYFSHSNILEPALNDQATRNAAWNAIKSGLNLSNLSPEILAHLYENALITPQLRKKRGIHATPPTVAEYMVSHLPIGVLDKNDRRIFEPFCGAAPFLIAGLGQLRVLPKEQVSPEEQHDYFQKMLVGMEIDAFSREIALCSLILADDTHRNSWQILGGDAYTSQDFDTHLNWANIVFCNPPHETFKKAGITKPATATYDTQAAEVLHRVLERKPSIIGFVLPRTFVDGDEYRTLRKEVAGKYSNISVVTLPDKVFKKAGQEVALLMAHNVGSGMPQYYSANVSEDEWDTFLRTRTPFDEYKSSALLRNEDNSPILWRPPLYRLWDYLAEYPTLDAYAEIHRGIEYNLPVEACVFDEPQSHTKRGIQTSDGYLEAFFIGGYQYLSVKPEEMRGKAYLRNWDRPKVLVNKSPSSRGYWRIVGTPDYEQMVASQMFFGIWARSDAPTELLAALTSSPLINAYTFAHEGKRDHRIDVLSNAPVPYFAVEQVELIVSLVRDYTTCRLRWMNGEGDEEYFRAKCLQRLWQIDAAVLEAYDLPSELESELLQRFAGAKREPLPFDFPGYTEGYTLAKEALKAERVHLANVRKYSELCEKKYRSDLSPAEVEEMRRLGQLIDAHEAEHNPLYGLVGIAEGGPPDGAENHDAYLYQL